MRLRRWRKTRIDHPILLYHGHGDGSAHITAPGGPPRRLVSLMGSGRAAPIAKAEWREPWWVHEFTALLRHPLERPRSEKAIDNLAHCCYKGIVMISTLAKASVGRK
jgi:hypothetical protein